MQVGAESCRYEWIGLGSGALLSLLLISGCGSSDHRSHAAGTSGRTTEDPPTAAAQLTVASSRPDVRVVSCPAATVTANSVDTLSKALANAKPGTVIRLADGTYTGKFVATASGTKQAPVYLCGGPGAILDGGGIRAGYALHLDHASYWRVIGFNVRNAQKGLVLDGSSHSVIQGLTVTDIGDEGIHLRSASTDDVVSNNTVSHTGQRRDKFGEGIYIGSATSNWSKYSAGGPDRSDNNVVIGNHISATTAESVDIKEGTTGGLVQANTFDGKDGLTGADSWVDVKGNDWQIVGNLGMTSPQDGFQTHQILDGWGTGNVFRANHANVDGPGYGINVTNKAGNTVYCDNTATGAGAGMTNLSCTR